MQQLFPSQTSSGSLAAAATSSLVRRFGTSADEASLLVGYWLSSATVDALVASTTRLPDSAVEATDVLRLPHFLSEAELQQVFDTVVALSGAALPPPPAPPPPAPPR